MTVSADKSGTIINITWLSHWYDWLRVERGYGANTLAAYERDIHTVSYTHLTLPTIYSV